MKTDIDIYKLCKAISENETLTADYEFLGNVNTFYVGVYEKNKESYKGYKKIYNTSYNNNIKSNDKSVDEIYNDLFGINYEYEQSASA